MTEHDDEIEQLLNRLRHWFQETGVEAATDTPADAVEDELAGAGVYRLVEEFTALRHEVKLQTRSARSLQEQTEALLPALRQAIEQFRAVTPREAQAAFSAGKPMAETLAELDEALDRGRVELEKVRERLLVEPGRLLLDALDALHARQSWLGRRRTRGYHQQVREVVAQTADGPARPLLDALIEGYDLIQRRLRRALDALDVRPIPCVGQPVDPNFMTVIDLVDDSDVAPGHVVAEVRRGYTWQGRLLRYAEVRAARGLTATRNGPAATEPEPLIDQE